MCRCVCIMCDNQSSLKLIFIIIIINHHSNLAEVDDFTTVASRCVYNSSKPAHIGA